MTRQNDAAPKAGRMELDHIINRITGLDEGAMQEAHGRWARVAKPLGSLGALEKAVEHIAGIQGSAEIALAPRCVAVMCADNGVVAEGVTQTGAEVTAKVAAQLAHHSSSVCVMARVAHT